MSSTDTTVVIYEATTASTATVSKTILNVEMLKNSYRDITGLNLLITAGRYVNGKCDDDDVFVTLMGYYVPKIS